MIDILALAIGYLLGAVLPAYLIGRAAGVDLRKEGDGNPGSTNALRVLGPGPGYLTLAYDMLKGPLAVAIGLALGAGEWATSGAGVAAFLGHRHPFYLRFRGGRGFATASGLLIFGFGYAVWAGFLPMLDAAVLLALFIALWRAFGDRAVPDALVLPLAYLDVAVRGGTPAFLVFMGVIVSYVWTHNFRRVRREGLLRRRSA